jgi:hypothetical protein
MATIACAAIVESVAEKIVALTRRAGAELTGARRTRDPALVRHVYDLHVIREHYDPAEVAALAREIMLADAETYGGRFPGRLFKSGIRLTSVERNKSCSLVFRHFCGRIIRPSSRSRRAKWNVTHNVPRQRIRN